MEDTKLGKLTVDDLGAIAGGRLNRKKYTKLTVIGCIVMIAWVVIVGLVTIFAEGDNDDPEYKVYQIREHIVVFNQMPTELPTNDLKLYTDGDLEYMGARYAPSYTENNGDSDDRILPVVLMIIPFIAWLSGFFYLIYKFDREKRDFVDDNCEVTIS